jgi:NADPH:quinone reductase-like Zn-dependent oxidoreductase
MDISRSTKRLVMEPEIMKAATRERYGDADVLEIREIARPEPGDGEILVKVYRRRRHHRRLASARRRLSRHHGAARPPDDGPVPAEEPGARQSPLPAASSPAARMSPASGSAMPVFGFSGAGAHAEYLVRQGRRPGRVKPEAIGYDEAAAVPFGGLSALVFLRDFASVKPGEKILVNGASGGVGSYAVQLAKHISAPRSPASPARTISISSARSARTA